jgi:cytochrome P450
MPGGADLDDIVRLMDPAFYSRDPHPAYAVLRREAPVWWCEAGGFWAVAKHADIGEIAARPQVFSSAHGSFTQDVRRRGKVRARAVSGVAMSFGADAPEHTRYRRLVSHAFTPSAAAAMEQTVRDIVCEQLDAMELGEPVDVVTQLAVPVSINVIAGLLGVPRSDWADFKRWSDAVSAFPDAEPDSDEERRLAGELDDFAAYLLARLDERRREPRGDLLTTIAAVELDDESATPRFQLALARALLVAGNETTRNTISAGVIALARHPEQLRALVEDRTLAGAATEEILRWTSVIHAFVRRATTDTVVREQEIAAGEFVALLFPAANRDEDAWTDADGFQITRRGQAAPHLAYSWGPHRCLGVHLANLEIRVTLEELVTRCAGWEQAGEPVRRASTIVDTYDEVPARLFPR